MKQKEIKRSFLESAKRFFEPYKTSKLALLKGLLVTFLWGSNSIVHIFFLERLTKFLELGNKEIFKNILLYYFLYITIFELVMFLTKKWGWVELIPRSWTFISDKYFRSFVKLNNNKIELEGTGKLISIIGEGIKQWGLILWSVLEQGIRLIVSVLFAFFMVTKVNLVFGVIFILLFLLFSIISTYFSNKLNPHRKERNDNINNIYRFFAKLIMSKTEVLHTDKIKFELSNINSLYVNDERINKAMSINRTIMNRNSDFIMGMFFLASYYILGNLYFKNEIQLSTIVGFGGALILMQKSTSEALSFYIQFTKDFVIIKKLWDFFDTTPEIQGYETGKEFIYKSGAIELQNITFGYEENKKIFKNFNLKLNGGKITAFVGNSGGGKTTLVKIISQYIKQDSGKVLIDGQDLDEVSLKSYYKNIGYLTQEPSVFDGSILDNLTYALEKKTPPAHSSLPPQMRGIEGELSKIHEIISLSKCEFIYDFEKGLETEIGERGVRLSGGQKQRLAIAKIMLKDPKIIILDEPTSALDSFSEELITKAMNNLFEGRTVLVIAHRLQTVKHADEIIVIENGEIAERGNHNELVEKNGIYNRMLELQSGF